MTTLNRTSTAMCKHTDGTRLDTLLGVIQADIAAAEADIAALETSISATGLGVINVMSAAYGAAGNGTADDTAEIQAAIDAAEAAGGGVVWFPPGKTFKITSPLTIQGSDVHVSGYGATVRASYGDNNVFLIAGASGADADHVRRISICGLNIQVSTSTTAGAAIRAVSCKDILIRDVHVGHGGMAGTHKFVSLGDDTYADNVKNATIDRCYVEHNSADSAIELISGAICVVSNSFFNGPSPPPSGSQASIIAQASTTRNWDGLVVHGNTGETWPRGLLQAIATKGISNVRITNNIVEPGVTLSQITCFPAPGGGDPGECKNWLIANNNFNNADEAGGGGTSMGIRFSQASGGTVQNIVISNNVFRGAGAEGIRIDGGTAVAVTGNVLWKCGTSGTPGVTIGAVNAPLVHGNIIDGMSAGMTYALRWDSTGSDRTAANNIYRGFATANVDGTP
jgi:hypothetical protein